MKTKLALLLLSAFCFPLSLLAQGTAFTYQGRLNDDANPAGGVYDLRFRVWDSEVNGLPASTTLTYTVSVTNGLFTVLLDFGSGVFTGQSRWLEISVRTNGAGAFTTLLPRQPMTATPYALYAVESSSSAVAQSVTPGNISTAMLGDEVVTSAKIVNGTIAAMDLSSAVASNTFWRLDGNANTTPGAHFIGSSDNQPLELKVNQQRALRLEPNPTGAPNLIGGSPVNYVSAGVVGATIGGGGATNRQGARYTNSVAADFGTLGGGARNAIRADASAAAIGGGFDNTIQNSAEGATIGGGYANVIQSNAYKSTISGGYLNTIETNATMATIGGGLRNVVSGAGGFIGGGGFDGSISLGNTASGIGSAIVGGTQNQAGGNRSTIGGGHSNSATNWYATVPGGAWNLAGGQGSFAGGRSAQSLHDGSFVWNDSWDTAFASTSPNQFLIHASSGVGINTNNPNGAALNVHGIISATSFSGSGAGLSGVNADLLDGQHGAYYQNAGNLNAGSLADTRLSANVALLNSSQTFSAAKTFNAGLRMNFTDLYFTSGSDLFHGLGWYGAGKLFAGKNVNGPVLYGNGGGALGAIGTTTNLALQWTSTGNVALDPLAVNSGSLLPGLTFGGNSGEGISSKRTAGTGQFGLDFYANYALRMRIGNNGNVGINTDNPQSALHVNGTATVDANLKLPVTTAGAGIIYFGTNTFLHGYGGFNLFAGQSAGNLTMTGWGNVGIGWVALGSNAAGNYNTGLGYATLNHNTAGEFNTASGFLALGMNTNGGANTANGYLALFGNTSGYGNTALGYYAGFSITTGSNNICIGNEGTAADNATIRIGAVGTQTKTHIAGISGATASGGSAVYVTALGQLGTLTSSRRFKTDIQDMGDASDALLALRPVTFRYLPEVDPQGLPQYGLIAEEVEQVNPDLVVHDEQGRPYTVRYEAVNAMLLQEFLKDHRQVEAQEIALQGLGQKLAAQHAENAELKHEVAELKRVVSQLSDKINGGAK
jgi:hypothetical protein